MGGFIFAMTLLAIEGPQKNITNLEKSTVSKLFPAFLGESGFLRNPTTKIPFGFRKLELRAKRLPLLRKYSTAFLALVGLALYPELPMVHST